MGQRGGTADLPLHGGRVPPWLAQRMARLGRIIVEALVLEFGRDEVLRRLAHPFWFQAFGAVLSSGSVELLGISRAAGSPAHRRAVQTYRNGGMSTGSPTLMK